MPFAQVCDLHNPERAPIRHPDNHRVVSGPASRLAHSAHVSSVTSLSVSGDKKVLASSDASGQLLLWAIGSESGGYDLSEAEPVPLIGHVSAITGTGFLHVANAQCLFTVSVDRTLRVRAHHTAWTSVMLTSEPRVSCVHRILLVCVCPWAVHSSGIPLPLRKRWVAVCKHRVASSTASPHKCLVRLPHPGGVEWEPMSGQSGPHACVCGLVWRSPVERIVSSRWVGGDSGGAGSK